MWRIATAGCLAVLMTAGAGHAQPTDDAPPETTEAIRAAPAPAPPKIEWRVLDRFRLFMAEPRPIDRITLAPQGPVDAMLQRLATADPMGGFERSTDFAASYKILADFLQSPQAIAGRPADLPFRHTRWVGAQSAAAAVSTDNRRYENDYLYPRRYMVAARVSGLPDGLLCAWSADRMAAFTAPCDNEVSVPVAALGVTASGIVGRTTLQVTVVGIDPAPVIASASVEVRDRLILSLGDSYASGEGDPDRPTNLSALGAPTAWDPESAERWWLDPLFLTKMKPAAWTDGWCHRSLMSQHFVAAIVYAARHPQEAVSYASFACSGASVYDGVLAPQPKPPGAAEFAKLPPASNYQLRSVIRLLCQGEHPVSRTVPQSMITKSARFKQKKTDTDWLTVSAGCPSGRKARKVDTVLLSLGGNDIGFSGVISDALLPRKEPPVSDSLTGQWAVDIVRAQAKTRTPQEANRAINNDLPRRYGMVDLALKSTFGPGVKVVQATYPNPLRQGSGPGQTRLCAGFTANTAFGSMHGLFPDRNVGPDQRWRLSIDENEADRAEGAVFAPLNDVIRANAALPGWAVVDDYQNRFLVHGWCARGAGEPRADFPFWRFEATGASAWTPYAPRDWRPYARQDRWFRTANDAVLTQISNLNGSAFNNPTLDQLLTGLLKLSGAYTSFLESGPASAISGSFHPTFAGHVAMGVETARTLEMQR